MGRPHLLNRFVDAYDHAPVDAPAWLITGLEYAIKQCYNDYDPLNETADWNNISFVDDRHPQSLYGGYREVGFYMSGAYPLDQLVPYLDKDKQSGWGLDYKVYDRTGQVKGCVRPCTGGQIWFDRDWLNTLADELTVVIDSKRIALTGLVRDWVRVVHQVIDAAEHIDPGFYTIGARNKGKLIPIDASEYASITTTHQLPEWAIAPKVYYE